MKYLLLTALLCSLYFNAVTQVNLNQGLIAYYSFNGTANDVSGQNNNPTYNSTTLTTDRYGNANSACNFDGIDDYIIVPGTAGMNTATAMTVAMYFNTELTTLQNLIGKIGYYSGEGAQFQVAINFNLYPGILYGVNNPVDICNSQIALNSAYVNTGGTVPTNQWHCLVCTYEAGVQKIYLNGLLVSTNNTSFNTLRQCTNSDIQIGTWWQNDQLRFKGKMDDIRIYNRALNQTEVNALCLANLVPVTASFTAPDTVCVNTPVTITNTSSNATTNYWSFCTGNLNAPPVGANFSSLNSNLTSPVYIDYVQENGNYYGFMTDNYTGHLFRLEFGNSLLTPPAAIDLGDFNSKIPDAAEGIQVVKNEGKWYAIIVGGTLANGTTPCILKVEFGANIANNAPVATNWGNIGNLAYPHDLYLFSDNAGVWHGLTVNSDNSTITRFNFTNSFDNTPTAANLGNIGNLSGPTGIHAINDNGNWYAFVANANSNTLSRLDFGNSLFNVPTGTNLGNIGGQFHTPWDIQMINYCGELIGYVINANTSYNSLIKLNFSTVTSPPTATSFGNIGNMNFPHCLSKIFRAGADLYTFVPNVSNQTLTRLQFTGCNNASVPNSTSANPGTVTYNTPGTYNITLTVDDGLPTQTSICKQVVVLAPPVHTPTQAISLCGGNPVKIGTGVQNAQYTWNTGATTDSIAVNTPGIYWVQTDRYGCSNRDSMVVTSCDPCANWLSVPNKPSYVNIGDLDIPGNTVTVEAMINRTATYSGGLLYAGDVVSKHHDPTDVNYLLRPNTAEITTTNGYYRTPDVCEIDLNKTYHVAMVYDGSTLKFYRDGFLMSQVAATGNLIQNNWHTQVGLYDALVLNTQFIGYINEVRIWNVARSQAQIRQYMNTPLPSPTTQTGLQAYYTFDNLLNKQGNATWNGTLGGSATINATNPNCTYTPDSCKAAIAQFTTPDTVCVNTPVNITNLSLGASTYYWNFCVADVNTPPAAVNIGNPNNLLAGPVFMDYVYTNGNYYAFVVNYNQARLVRLDFGNSLLNPPSAVDLGNYGGLLQVTANEGIQVVQDGGNWYAIIVGGNVNVGQQPRILKIDFGTNITSPGTPTNWGNVGNLMNQPIDLHVFREGGNWYGFTVNAEFNTITRFNFGSNFNNAPTATDLGNIGGLKYPTGIYAINDNGYWRVFVVNGGDNQRNGTASSLTRLDFGSSLLNTPTGVNLGNPGNMLHHPRDFTIMKFCGQIVGFAVNGNPSYNDIVRLNFSNDLTVTPTITSLGNLGNLNFPHSISRLFRVNDEVYTFITNVANNTITRLRFQGCANASVSSSTLQDPLPVTYSSPGTYNINLTIDDGLPTQTSYCKQVVVLDVPAHTPTKALDLCTGDSIKIGTGIKYAQYTWNTGAKTDSITAKTAGTYWVQTDRYGCTNRDSTVITALAKPVVNLGPDLTLCDVKNVLLDAGNAGAGFLWQDGSTAQTFTANSSGKYYVRVTNTQGCVNSDTISLSKVTVIPADLYYKQAICNPLAVQFYGTGNNLSNAYWVFGDGNSATGNLNSANTYAAFGNYTVKFGYETNGCKDTITRTIAIQVTNADLILTPDTTICFNTTKQLRAQPALSFCWSPGTFLNNANVTNPVTSTPGKITYYYTAEVTGNNLITNGNFNGGNSGFTSGYSFANPNVTEGQYFVGASPQTWNPSLSTCTDHTTGNGNMLLVNGAPVANVNVWNTTVAVTPNTNYAFSTWIQALYTPNPAQLSFSINGRQVGSPITASLPTCTWSQFYTTWNSGNNTTATIAIVNNNTQVQGNDFALDDISFAPVFIQRDSVIISVDTPIVKTNNDTTICINGKVQLQASGAATFNWTPAAGLNNTTISNPVASPVANTSYIVTGQTINGCTAKDTVAISLHAVPTIITDHDLVTCPNTPVQLTANTTMATYSWTPAAAVSNPAIANPMATTGTNAMYKVQVTDAYNCSYSDSVYVQVRTFKFSAGMNAVICKGSSITMQAIGGDQYLWTPASSLNDAASATPIATPDTTTLYHVTIRESNCGTDTTFHVRIAVNPTPVVKAEKINDIDCLVHSAKLKASGSAGSSYLWAPARGLDYPTLPDPVSTADTTTTYFVTGTNQYGCSDIDSVTVYVTATGKVSFEVPNAFTPNGDGLNDCLGLKSWGGATIEEFSIFSRWGERVFTTNKPGVCWDGRFRGEPLPAGGYTYIIKAKTYCGTIKRSGIVMLLR
ncbi:hypothetical protein A3860_35560 [Niastella vici]|uniref:PKD domain-containing protein n=1 Tax=Niastella vici TaxID=1703345 RepID=A0A1V9FNP4_9BACT|nr:LamG-like jellyroll fold domain-containing protein [Niastella vici]OQP59962.1 hypothetical protein A3860_35560 [Niastella vici]